MNPAKTRPFAFLVLGLSLLAAACSRGEPAVNSFSETERVAMTLVINLKEDYSDPNNNKRIDIAKIAVGNEGGLRLTVLEKHPRIAQLRSALKEIKTLPALPLGIHDIAVVKGKRVGVSRTFNIIPGNKEYGHAVAEHLMTQYGFGYNVDPAR